jgi:hypothetical protein
MCWKILKIKKNQQKVFENIFLKKFQTEFSWKNFRNGSGNKLAKPVLRLLYVKRLTGLLYDNLFSDFFSGSL